MLLGLIWFFGLRNPNANEQTLVVEPGEFLQQVAVSGKVTPAHTVDLAFDSTGRVASIPVAVGTHVKAGQVVATLSNEVLYSQLQAARINLQKVRNVQDSLVASAYRKLLSTDLAAIPDSSDYGVAPPTLTGLYQGGEGQYKLNIIHDQTQLSLDNHELFVFGLERAGPIEIQKSAPTPVGSGGLYISFPDALNGYDNTIWFIDIPNTKSSSYATNQNEYQEALRTRDQALASAEAEVSRLEAQYSEGVLRAPFNGVVTAVPGEVGGISSANESVVSLISDSALQIEVYIPEVSISTLKVGDEASTTLDAYGPGIFFSAHVVSIDPAETVRDGVSTYRVVLEFTEQDPRIKAGMTANVTITTDRKENTFSIPQGALHYRDGQPVVTVKVGKKNEERVVTTGLRSSLGFVEITSGLSAGDVVVLSQ